MNKLTLLSLVVASVLFTGCGEDAKKAVIDAVAAAGDTISETTANAVDATKEAAANSAAAAQAKAAEVAEVAKIEAEILAQAAADKAAEAASNAADSIKDAAVATTSATGDAVASAKEAVAPNSAAGKSAYAKCAGCHGVDGKTKALGKSAVVAGQSAADLEATLAGYKAGTRNVSGMGMLMQSQVASMSDEDIKAVAGYMSGL
jgi:cytochrome c553